MPGSEVRVAVNVMRARQTVIGFNIAIVSFQIAQIYKFAGGVKVPGIAHQVHVSADIALFMSLALSLIALIAMTSSSLMDEVGVCTHWSLLIGDLLMYMALAYTLSGFFAPLNETMRGFTTHLPTQVAQAVILQRAVLLIAAVGWFLALYIAPLYSLLRSPFPRFTTLCVGLMYVALLFVFAWVNAQAAIIEAPVNDQSGFFRYLLHEFIQPLRW